MGAWEGEVGGAGLVPIFPRTFHIIGDGGRPARRKNFPRSNVVESGKVLTTRRPRHEEMLRNILEKIETRPGVVFVSLSAPKRKKRGKREELGLTFE